MDSLKDWVASRPAVVQKAAARWPLGSPVKLPDGEYLVIGWGETKASDRTGDPLDLMLILSPTASARASYEQMIANRISVCARHLTDG